MSTHVRYLFSFESYSSSIVCFTNVAGLFRQLLNVCWFHFEFHLSFDFWRSKVMSNTCMSRSERAVCVCSCVLVGCENCVPYNQAMIAKLIRSDCFFDQCAWCFPSGCSFTFNFLLEFMFSADETKLKMMQEVSENFEVKKSPKQQTLQPLPAFWNGQSFLL